MRVKGNTKDKSDKVKLVSELKAMDRRARTRRKLGDINYRLFARTGKKAELGILGVPKDASDEWVEEEVTQPEPVPGPSREGTEERKGKKGEKAKKTKADKEVKELEEEGEELKEKIKQKTEEKSRMHSGESAKSSCNNLPS